MPFSGHGGAVSARAERLGDGGTILAEIAAITGPSVIVHHMPNAGLMRIETGHQRGACRAAARTVIERGEARASGGERVNMRRLNLRSITADVGEAEIIGEQNDDIGTPGRGLAGRGKARAEREKLPP